MTVHRSQAATVDTTHRYEDGGDREVAYVAMSRARQSSHVYVVADNLDQAVEDLTREWSRERRARWAIDTGTPAPGLTEDRPRPTVTPDETMRLARLRAERAAVAAAIPPDPRPFLRGVEHRVAELRQAERDLQPGQNHYPSSPEGEAARALTHAMRQRRQAEAFAQMDGMSWRSRWDWQRSARRWGKEEHAAQGRYDRVAGPELKRLSQELGYLEANRGELTHQLEEREAWLSAHPEAERRLKSLDSQLSSTQPAGTRSLVDEALDRLGHQRQVAPKAPEQDLGLDAGIDFGL